MTRSGIIKLAFVALSTVVSSFLFLSPSEFPQELNIPSRKLLLRRGQWPHITQLTVPNYVMRKSFTIQRVAMEEDCNSGFSFFYLVELG